MRGSGGPPADDASRIDVDDEGDIDKTGPGRDIGKIRNPQRIWARRVKLAIDVVQRTRCRLVADRGPDRLAADHALQSHASHQPLYGAAGNVKALALQLPPDLAHAIDLEVLRKDAGDLRLQRHIPPRSRGELLRIGALGDMGMVGRGGERQDLADRLHPMSLSVIVDERDHGLYRRSSSAIAKYADALRRISLAWRSSRFSRSSAVSFAATSEGRPGARPLSRSTFCTLSRNVCRDQATSVEVVASAAQRDGCSLSCS